MNRVLITPTFAVREHEERLRRAEQARQASEFQHRMKLRTRLRKVILETIEQDGSTRDLAAEFASLVRTAERRLSRRPCC